MNHSSETYCGFVTLVGRPNVGKSSLLNKLLGQKISIISPKPQTTRHVIQGIKTVETSQTIYVDTPGMHLGGKRALNRQMNQVARQALIDVDVVVFVVEALKWTEEDSAVLHQLTHCKQPIILAVNKVDLVRDKTALLAYMQKLAEKLPQATLIPLSAKKGDQIAVLESHLQKLLPQSPFYYPPEQTRHHHASFHFSELIREKLLWSLEKELPYAISVEIEQVEEKPNITHIHAIIWVEREGQKAIVIGDKGQQLKAIGIKARKDLERFCDKKICLKLWVKVKSNWSDDMGALKSLGYVATI